MDSSKGKTVILCLTILLIVGSLVFGIVGFVLAGDGVGDAIFRCIQLFTLNYENDPPNLLIDIARISAPASIATTVLSQIPVVAHWIRDWIIGSFGGIVIYSDTDNGKTLYDDCNNTSGKNAILRTASAGIRKASKAVIMMSDDKKAFELYSRIAPRLKKKKAEIYLCLTDIEPGQIPVLENTTIMDTNNIIAGCFWKKNKNLLPLYSGEDSHYKNGEQQSYYITIVGFGKLGRRILQRGLLINLFSLKQRIIYNICILDSNEKVFPDKLDYQTMNEDEVIWNKGWPGVDLLDKSDIVILTEGASVGVLQNLLYQTKGEIYYYAPDGNNFEDIFETEKNRVFGFGHHYNYRGERKCIFSRKMVMNNSLIEKAKRIHLEYIQDQKAKNNKGNQIEWSDLDSVSRECNINQADYIEIGKELIKELNKGQRTEEELSELVHIGW